MYYHLFEEEGHFIGNDGLSYNLLFASHVSTPEGEESNWIYFNTFMEALNHFNLSIKEEYLEDYIEGLKFYNDFSLSRNLEEPTL